MTDDAARNDSHDSAQNKGDRGEILQLWDGLNALMTHCYLLLTRRQLPGLDVPAQIGLSNTLAACAQLGPMLYVLALRARDPRDARQPRSIRTQRNVCDAVAKFLNESHAELQACGLDCVGVIQLRQPG